MKVLGSSWKTTLAGLGAIFAALGKALSQYSSGGLAAVDFPVLLAALSAGIGLLLTKDFNVSNATAPGPAEVVKTPPASGGFVTLSLVFVLVVLACGVLLLPHRAHAYDTSTPTPAENTRPYGGCTSDGSFCYGPSAAVSLVAMDLRTKEFIAGIIPGVGYGFTAWANKPYALGLAGYASLQASGPSAGALFSGIVSFADYLRVGVGYQVAAGKGNTLLLLGIGQDFR